MLICIINIYTGFGELLSSSQPGDIILGIVISAFVLTVEMYFVYVIYNLFEEMRLKVDQQSRVIELESVDVPQTTTHSNDTRI